MTSKHYQLSHKSYSTFKLYNKQDKGFSAVDIYFNLFSVFLCFMLA